MKLTNIVKSLAVSLAVLSGVANAVPSNLVINGSLIDAVSVTAAVPEPSTYALLLAGLLVISTVQYRKKQIIA